MTLLYGPPLLQRTRAAGEGPLREISFRQRLETPGGSRRRDQRDARFRVALARGPVLCLISMNYWSNRAAGLEGVWSEVLRTLVIGLRIEDPTAGPVIQ